MPPEGKRDLDLVAYWRDRARQHGRSSVLNLEHGDRLYDAITAYQREFLFPLLLAQLQGWEKRILDFGCGPGRFSAGLAETVGGEVVGVDISAELLELAPSSPQVRYECIGTEVLPFENASFDVVWSCLVLGGIPERKIELTLAEVERVLAPGGLFFFIENTASVPDTKYWFFRDEESYLQLAAFCRPRVLARYQDAGQSITVFGGRKIPTGVHAAGESRVLPRKTA
jgi:SAM-dependent methyltransferase